MIVWGVTVHKHDGSVCTSVFYGFCTAGEKKIIFFLFNNGLLNKLLFLYIN